MQEIEEGEEFIFNRKTTQKRQITNNDGGSDLSERSKDHLCWLPMTNTKQKYKCAC